MNVETNIIAETDMNTDVSYEYTSYLSDDMNDNIEWVLKTIFIDKNRERLVEVLHPIMEGQFEEADSFFDEEREMKYYIIDEICEYNHEAIKDFNDAGYNIDTAVRVYAYIDFGTSQGVHMMMVFVREGENTYVII